MRDRAAIGTAIDGLLRKYDMPAPPQDCISIGIQQVILEVLLDIRDLLTEVKAATDNIDGNIGVN